ncbi:hypothetical protein [Butyrivibrio sp. NC3005]|uniref:hypothetical protein n=1 Tax=Butyrivibrio sp. NC3005 TaxID=1280685 RepID=UPI0004196877|nr:hypothetical protein [Butyrivibrio sp. NC3005]
MKVKDFICRLYQEDFSLWKEKKEKDSISKENETIDKKCEYINLDTVDDECELNEYEFLNYLWHQSLIDEYDFSHPEENLLRKNAARLIHIYMRDKMHQKDERDISKALNLRDIYDCRVCMNHIAQVYTKGIIEAIEIPGISSKENEKFRIFAGSYEAEDEDIEKWMDAVNSNR